MIHLMPKVENIFLFLTSTSCNFLRELSTLSLALLNPSLLPEHVTCSAHVQHDQEVRLSLFCRDLKSTSTEAGQGSSHCIPSNPNKPGWLGSPTRRRVESSLVSTTPLLWVLRMSPRRFPAEKQIPHSSQNSYIQLDMMSSAKTLGIWGTSVLSTFWKSVTVYSLAESRKSK